MATVSAMDYFREGRLNDAVAAAIEHVRNKPGDVEGRWFLCTLLCFVGDLDRVDKHLDLIAQQEPKSAAGISLYRQLVRAESARRQFYAEGRLPEFLGKPSAEVQLRLAASVRMREKDNAEAVVLLGQADEARAALTGKLDDKPFSDMRDLDDLLAAVFEVLTSTGKYYWVQMSRVRLLEFRPPAGPRDLLWRQARMAVDGGPDGEVYLPALYPGSHTQTDDQLRLGRSTEWQGGEEAPVRGIGQRMYLIGEEALAINDLKTLEFDAPAPAE